ncbi:MAG: cysteine hydrolase family protein [Azospirillaceae bacterium]|nr:cysteine hydrolase family protein [Azospirillaceae bacterium]
MGILRSPAGSALLLIDIQKAIDHPSWGERNNPSAEANIALLLAHWRAQGWPVWHVRHDSTHATSHYRPGQTGHEFKPETAPLPGEPIIAKRTNNAFIGTELTTMLNHMEVNSLVVVGVITNNSVEATVRMAGNLGYETYLVSDGSSYPAKAGAATIAGIRGFRIAPLSIAPATI